MLSSNNSQQDEGSPVPVLPLSLVDHLVANALEVLEGAAVVVEPPEENLQVIIFHAVLS